MPAERAVAFGPFRLFPERKLLLEGDRSIRLGSRALDILVALVERPGTLVSKEDLIARAWPNTFVEEANLRVHVAALRKALGDGRNGHRYLATDPGRGYRFVAPVSLSPAPEGAASAAEADTPRYSLPGLISRMIGRGDVVAALVNQLTNPSPRHHHRARRHRQDDGGALGRPTSLRASAGMASASSIWRRFPIRRWCQACSRRRSDSPPSTKRWRAPSGTRSAGAWRNCCAARARLSYGPADLAPPEKPNSILLRLSTGHAGRARVRGELRTPRASPICDASRAAWSKLAMFSRRSMGNSVKASRPAT